MENHKIITPGQLYWCKNQNGFKQALLHGFCGDEKEGREYEWQETKEYIGSNYPRKYPCYILIDQAAFRACAGRYWQIIYSDNFEIRSTRETFPIIQQQKWGNYTRHIIMIEGASVQLELYHKTAWFGGTAFLYALWTDPEHRKKGKAKELMVLAETIASNFGHKELFLECDQDNAPFVREWYYERGYIDRGTPRGIYLLKKSLT